jgi:hypothetical protein
MGFHDEWRRIRKCGRLAQSWASPQSLRGHGPKQHLLVRLNKVRRSPICKLWPELCALTHLGDVTRDSVHKTLTALTYWAASSIFASLPVRLRAQCLVELALLGPPQVDEFHSAVVVRFAKIRRISVRTLISISEGCGLVD